MNIDLSPAVFISISAVPMVSVRLSPRCVNFPRNVQRTHIYLPIYIYIYIVHTYRTHGTSTQLVYRYIMRCVYADVRRRRNTRGRRRWKHVERRRHKHTHTHTIKSTLLISDGLGRVKFQIPPLRHISRLIPGTVYCVWTVWMFGCCLHVALPIINKWLLINSGTDVHWCLREIKQTARKMKSLKR